ncbi:hypothetical protein HGQ17_07850 [Nesterenkonia sp. MY13]|uniref:Septum formation-related domain-containing protein n=1 Tax=Nesterenkonia sedimenti TaxID=1463632 RepID=A0A7X8TJW6_9MICC|nr:hypothetical protein [Nesterenkonia sedimenti]NLS09916.1 hypothetical protein [Nesterenkonia sedimenti]
MSKSSPESGASERPMTRRARREAAGDTGFRLNAWPFLIGGVLVVFVTAGLLWWFLVRNDAQEPVGGWEWTPNPADGVHARDVPPEDWQAGWCLSGFTSEEEPAHVVDCERSYDLQLLVRDDLDEDGEYPGDESLVAMADELCQADVEIDAEALEEAEEDLHFLIGRPTESGWNNEGDREVSCFLGRVDEGRMSGDFLPTRSDDAESIEEADLDSSGETEGPEADEPEASPEETEDAGGDGTED